MHSNKTKIRSCRVNGIVDESQKDAKESVLSHKAMAVERRVIDLPDGIAGLYGRQYHVLGTVE